MSSDLSKRDIFMLVFTFMAVSCAIIIILLSLTGNANIIEESIFGKGSIDHTTYSKNAYDRVITDNAESLAYKVIREWDGTEQKFSSSFTVYGVKGGYKNQYEVRSYGAGYKHTYLATKINGSFSGSGDITNSVVLETGADSIDSLVLMDGNATFRGRIINGQTGRPVTESEMDAVGELVIRSYLNITDIPDTPEDWLEFCKTLEDRLPSGLMIKSEGNSSG